MIDTAVHITNRHNFYAAPDSALYHGCYILNDFGSFVLGRTSHLGAYCYVNVNHGSVTIGDDVAIGPNTCIIAYSNHYEVGKRVTEMRLTKDIQIGNNVFIGANCAILPGSVIEDNVVVGAGAVVKGRLAADTVYAGVPARQLKALVDAQPPNS